MKERGKPKQATNYQTMIQLKMMINHTEKSNYYVYNRIDGTNDISKVDDIR